MKTSASTKTFPIRFVLDSNKVRKGDKFPYNAGYVCQACSKIKPLEDFRVLLNGEAATRVGYVPAGGFRLASAVRFRDVGRKQNVLSFKYRPTASILGPICVMCE